MRRQQFTTVRRFTANSQQIAQQSARNRNHKTNPQHLDTPRLYTAYCRNCWFSYRVTTTGRRCYCELSTCPASCIWCRRSSTTTTSSDSRSALSTRWMTTSVMRGTSSRRWRPTFSRCATPTKRPRRWKSFTESSRWRSATLRKHTVPLAC